jgi:NADH-quinone oxidoreductase subunit J
MVLFVFAIMLLIPGKAESGPDPLARQRMLALPVAAIAGVVVALVLPGAGARQVPAGPPAGVRTLGELLFTDYLFPFELTSVLLLAALIGALVLAKRRVS